MDRTTVPTRWDDESYSNAYGDSDAHSYADDDFDSKAASHARTAPESLALIRPLEKQIPEFAA
jgi:hypothetical protein